MNVPCPQCGNPNLDVDAENSVVYCKNCGFAVKVDPQSGEVTPLTQPAGGPTPSQPQAYVGGKMIFGFDPTTFFLGATALAVLGMFLQWYSVAVFSVAEALLVIYWWYNH